MNSPLTSSVLSITDYLQNELMSDIKHEYIEGLMYAIAGASKNHQRIITNLIVSFGSHLENTPCDTFSSDIKVRVGDLAFFYPDVIIACQDDTDNEYYLEKPLIIVEVLSKSTRRRDETTKRRLYQTLPSLQEYVLIEQDFVDVEVCRRHENWQPEHYFMGDDIIFSAIDLKLAVQTIYNKVINDDVKTFFTEPNTL